jgi:hypothetical protein
VACRARGVKRLNRHRVARDGVDVGAASDQQLNDVQVREIRGELQRREAVACQRGQPPRIFVEEPAHGLGVAGGRCLEDVERRAGREQDLDDVGPVAVRPLENSRQPVVVPCESSLRDHSLAAPATPPGLPGSIRSNTAIRLPSLGQLSNWAN